MYPIRPRSCEWAIRRAFVLACERDHRWPAKHLIADFWDKDRPLLLEELRLLLLGAGASLDELALCDR
jgi:hypothetical protein